MGDLSLKRKFTFCGEGFNELNGNGVIVLKNGNLNTKNKNY